MPSNIIETPVATTLSRSRHPFGLGSMRGRFLLGATLFIATLFAAVWLTESRVQGVTARSIASASQRDDITQMLKNLTVQMWVTQTTLQRYLWQPNAQQLTLAKRSLEQTFAQAGALNGVTYVSQTPAAQNEVNKIVRALNELRLEGPWARDKIESILGDIWVAIDNLEKAMEGVLAADLTNLNRTAGALSRTLEGFAILALFLTGLGYFFIEKGIRRPLAHIAAALRAEARGQADVVVTHTTLSETDDLVDAFDHMRQQVRTRQQRLETILDNAAEGIITFDEQGLIETANLAAERLFGYTQQEIKGKDISLLIPPTESLDKRKNYIEHFMRQEITRLIGHEGEVTGRHKDGTRFPMALKVSKIILEGRPLYTGLVADISERKSLMEHLKKMAEHDGLTGQYNRTYFTEELERAVHRVKRGGQSCALLYFDLDNFKYINDTLGHAAGDQLLIEIAAVMNKRARKSDIIARLGGDEFTILLYDTRAENAPAVAESFRKVLSDYQFIYKKERVNIGCSIGVALLTVETESAAQALSHADIGCHLAKLGGRNRVHVFSSADQPSITNMALDMGWSQRIKEAIAGNLFTLACQPIFDTRNMEIESYEVLIRLRAENGEYILPGGFLPSAERFGLAVDVDKWVILHAIDTLAEQRKQLPNLRFAINLSGPTLSDSTLYALITERLKVTGLEPSALTFEVTETVAISDINLAAGFLTKMRALGCLTALDDFGSGFSSFAYLRDLPVDLVKIDGHFVKNMADNPVDQAMVKAMNDIIHTLGKRTVAEWVETEEASQLLVSFGVDYVQGFHFGRPDVLIPCELIAHQAGVGKMCLK